MQRTPRGLCGFVARALARKGENALALALSPEDDPILLSRLGMHHSALPLLPRQPGRRHHAVALVRSLAGLGLLQEAASHAHEFARRWPDVSRALASLVLPALAPDSALLGWPAHKAASLCAAGRFEEAMAVLNQALADSRDVDVALLRAACAAGRREAGRLEQHLNEALAIQGLRPVRFLAGEQGIKGLHAASLDGAGALPLVSVVVPVHNVASWVGAALESLRRQDYRPLEVIVVDDASTDETKDRVLDAARKEAGVRYVRTQQQAGPYAARNVGLQMARGEFVTFHDGDDWSHPQKIALQVEHLQRRPRAIGCVSDWARLADDGSPVARQGFPLVRLNTSSLMFRRQPALERAGFFDCVRTGADSEYLARLRLIFGTDAIGRVKKLLSFASWRPDSLTQAADTGFASLEGTKQRVMYWEAWNRWHARLLAEGRLDELRLSGAERPFAVPQALWSSAHRSGDLQAS